jgi:hypothetical protein
MKRVSIEPCLVKPVNVFSKKDANQERAFPDNNEPMKPLVWSHQDNEKDEDTIKY